MIRSVIFDMGNVLIPFEPDVMMANAGVQEEDRFFFRHEVFFSREWIMFDRGTLEEDEVKRRIAKNLPVRLHSAMEYVFNNIFEGSEPDQEITKLILDCKRAGLGVYLLSNASKRFYDYKKRIPSVELMDGMLVSCDAELLKPDPAIFWLLFDKFNLEPENCFFIDDMALNIEAADYCGMRGFVYRRDIVRLRAVLYEAGVQF